MSEYLCGLAPRIPLESEWGVFGVICLDAEHDSRPNCSIRFDRLVLSNRSMGLLRTALQKTAHVENLRCVLFTYADHSQGSGDGEEGNPAKLLIHEKTSLAALAKYAACSTEHVRFPDISKATHFEVSGFTFKLRSEGQSELTVRSQRAVMSAEAPGEIRLAGRVVLEAHGRKLEATRATWNFDGQYFQIDGRCFVSSETQRHSAVDARLDYSLTILKTEPQARGD